MAYDRYFGFDTTQKQTLEKLLAEAGAPAELVADVAALESAVADLETRVAALEAETP